MEDLIKKLKKTLADFQQAIQSRVQTNVLPATKSFIQSIQPAGGWQAGIERVKQTPLREFFLPTATEVKPLKEFGEGVFGGIKRWTTPYLSLLGSAGLTLGSEAATSLGSLKPFMGTEVGSKLADIGVKSAEKAYEMRQRQGTTGSFDQGLLPAAKTIAVGAGATGKALLGTYGLGSGAAIPSALFSTALTYLGGKISKQPVTTKEIGAAVGYSPVYAGIARLFNPMEEAIATKTLGKVNYKTMPFLQAAKEAIKRGTLKGSIYGGANVLEDEFLTRLLEQRKPTGEERLFSFGAGMLLGQYEEGSKAAVAQIRRTGELVKKAIKDVFRVKDDEVADKLKSAYAKSRANKVIKFVSGAELERGKKPKFIKVAENKYVREDWLENYFAEVDKKLGVDTDFDIEKINLGLSIRKITPEERIKLQTQLGEKVTPRVGETITAAPEAIQPKVETKPPVSGAESQKVKIIYNVPPEYLPARGKPTLKTGEMLYRLLKEKKFDRDKGIMSYVISTLEGENKPFSEFKSQVGQPATSKQWRKLYALYKSRNYDIEGYKKLVSKLTGSGETVIRETVPQAEGLKEAISKVEIKPPTGKIGGEPPPPPSQPPPPQMEQPVVPKGLKERGFVKTVRETLKDKPEIPKIKVQSSDLDILKKFANWEQVSEAEREKVGQIVTQKLGLLPEQWAYESGTGQRRLAQKALEQMGEIKGKISIGKKEYPSNLAETIPGGELSPKEQQLPKMKQGKQSSISSSAASSEDIISQELPPWETPEFLKEHPEFKEQKIPEIETTKNAQATATIKGGTGKVDPEVKSAFADWVNQRRATKVEGLLKQKEFSDLNSLGIEGMIKFQSEAKPTGRFADVKKYFDNKYKELQDTGIEFHYKKNYLPQLWENSPEEVEQVFGRKLGTKPSFTLESLIKNYQEGIEAGLTPKYKTISELVGWYERTANKAIADKKFFEYLAKEGLIQPANKAPTDWKTLNPDSFPKIKVAIPGAEKRTEYIGVFKAPSDLADMINNYLSTPEMGGTGERLLARIANYVSSAKNRMLSFGIPGTGINFHGFNILARSFLEGGPGGALKTVYYMINPKAAENFVEENLAKAPEAIKSGLSFSTSERQAQIEGERILSKLGRGWNNLFEAPLFDKIITAKKLEGWEKLWKEYAKTMPESQAKKEAANFINTLYGGINWEQWGRSRNVQNFLRTILLTPDWLESNLRLGGGILKSVLQPTNPIGKAYRKALTYLLASYVTMNIINKMTSGHWMFENDPGHLFEVEAGYTPDGQKRYIRPYGTAIDFIRIPIDIIVSLLKNDPSPLFRAIGNRLSVIVSPAIHLIGNVNWAGQPIYGKDKYGKPMPLKQQAINIGSELGTVLGFPSFIGQFGRTLTGQQGLEQGLLQGFEFPVRYSGGYFSSGDKEIAEALGLKGKERYELSKILKEQPAFSEKQKAIIKIGGRDVLNQIIQQREKNKKIEEVKKQAEQGNMQQQGSLIPININGEIKVIDLSFQPKLPALTGNTELDKKAISKFNSDINKKANDIYDLYLAGKITAEEAEKELTKLKDLKAAVGKLTKKGKKIKVPKVAAPKAPKINLKLQVPKSKTIRIKGVSLKAKQLTEPKIGIKIK